MKTNTVKVIQLIQIVFIVLFATGQVRTQDIDNEQVKRNLGYELKLNALYSTAQTPFWIRSNRYGTIPRDSPSILPEIVLKSDYRPGTDWDWGFKIDVMGVVGNQTELIIPEAHLKARWKKLEIFAGRKKQILGLVGDSLNTSGSYIQSGNALPIPMIQIGLLDFVPLFNDFFAFKGNYAHGWFDGNKITKDHFLHQKSLYLRLGRAHWPLRLYAGINHQVQWGGTIVRSNQWTAPGQTKYPQSLKDYWWVVTSKRIPTFGLVDTDQYDAIDRGNRIGNHLGTMDFAAEIKLKNADITSYKQFIYDDGSLFQLLNLVDGLYGISIKSKPKAENRFTIEGLTLEYLYTVHQGGSHFDLDGGNRGRDNYLNHAQYLGWVYQDNGIGTPFIPNILDTERLQPNHEYTHFSINNRVKMMHLGFNGRLIGLNYLVKASYSQNVGHYNYPLEPALEQTSLLLRLEDDIFSEKNRLNVFIEVGADFGELYKNTLGAQLGIKKKGWF